MMQMLGEGFITSLQIFALTLVGALPLGVVVVALRMCRFAPVRLIARAYISVMRGTPLMLQMFAIYFMPFYVFGVQLTPSSVDTSTRASCEGDDNPSRLANTSDAPSRGTRVCFHCRIWSVAAVWAR